MSTENTTKKVKTPKTTNSIALQNKTWKSIKDAWQLYLLLLLPVVYLLVFAYYPMYGVTIAFKQFSVRKGIIGSPWVGFKYFKFLTQPEFKQVFINTITVSIYSLAASFPLPIILALGLNTMRNKAYKKTVQMITYLPHFISTVVMVGILSQFFNSRVGMLKQILDIIAPGIKYSNPMGSATAFQHLYVWSGVWQGMGWSTIIYLAALANVDAEQTEAALIDGATRFQRVIHIDFPAIIPTIVILLILNCGSIMNVGFEKVLLMQADTNLAKSQIISTFSYQRGIVKQQFETGAAIGLFNSVVNLILITTVNKISKTVSETSLW